MQRLRRQRDSQASRVSKLMARYDFWLIGTVILLILVGLIFVASSSITMAEQLTGDPLYYFWRQLFATVLGLSFAGIVIFTPLDLWQQVGVPILLIGIFLLVLVLIPGVGREVNGSMRWISFGQFNFQGSEFVKISLITYLAGYLVRHGDKVRSSLAGFITPIGVVTLIAGLLLLEPDYGTAVVLFATALGMLFMGGVPLGRFIAWMLTAIVALISLAIMSPYRLQRLTSFLDPWQDPFNSGFQLTQALIAFGRGDWIGAGLGSGVQKLFYLPEAHTDFVFAVLGEELGLIGSVILILLFFFLVWRSFVIAQISELSGKPFAALLAYGIGVVIGIQAFFNMGVNTGLLPTKGLTLPFMSYGGNSMISNCILLAILVRIEFENHHSTRKQIPDAVATYVA